MTHSDSEFDTIDIVLRCPATVARRCVILGAIAMRFGVDSSLSDDPFAAAFDVREWLRVEGLWDDTTKREKAYFSRPPGSSEQEGDIDIASIAESLATLAWSLGLLDSLSENRLAELAVTIRDLPGPWDKTDPWVSARRLRPETDIASQRERHEIWVWRLAIEPDRRSSDGRELSEIELLVREVTSDAVSAGLFPSGKNGEFTIGGVPLTSMTPSEIDELHAISQERLKALNWICGFGESWDNVPLDV